MPAIAFTPSRNYARRPRAAAGFSLIELAVVVAIISLLLGSLLVPLQSQVESRKLTETQKILDNAREALIGYAAANGYFPCPAAYGGTTGAEATPNDHNSASSTNCPASPATANVTGGGAGGVYIGYLPGVTLGFTPTDTNGYALDAWQNRVRYAVSNTTVNGQTVPFTRTNGMRLATMSSILNLPQLSVCNATPSPYSKTACGPASTTLTSNAIVVIWSLGANAATTGGISTHEAENAEPITSADPLAIADRVFVMRDPSKVVGSEFDDIVTWISTPMLFSRLIAAGQLP
jgi:prepilin-type N-terminal cleavage/methylation domain-containing protein